MIVLKSLGTLFSLLKRTTKPSIVVFEVPFLPSPFLPVILMSFVKRLIGITFPNPEEKKYINLMLVKLFICEYVYG